MKEIFHSLKLFRNSVEEKTKMSSIDQYLYTCIGVIECPTSYRLFYGQSNIQPIHIAIYHLEQDIPEHEDDFQGKAGDIIVGGGSGEAPAMVIKLPDAFIFFTRFEDIEDEKQFEKKYSTFLDHTPFQTYWTLTQTYILGAGFETLGWNPEKEQLDRWLTHHVLVFLLKHYPDQFKWGEGKLDLRQNGSICRKITDIEDRIWNWKKHKYNLNS